MLWLLALGYSIPECLLSGVVLLLSITIHEVSHALVALWLGDPTARNLGRLTLDPRAHLTKWGLFALIFLPFGWANPVPIVERNFKNYKRDTLLVALAGPLSNLIVSFVAMFLMFICATFVPMPFVLISSVVQLLEIAVFVNIGLAIFNLIPFPPLDGSKILFTFLPYKYRNMIFSIQQYGFIILIVMLNLFTNFFQTAIVWVYNLERSILLLLPFFGGK